MALTTAEIDAGFLQVRNERALERRLTDVRDPEFWRALNPDLTISYFPLSAPRDRLAVPPAAIDR